MRLAVLMVALFAASCSRAETAENANNRIVLVGSSSCGAAIKSELGIAAEMKCDFIRWNLALDQTSGKTFTLDINYGEGQPNTKGFIGGGQKMSVAGKFEVGPKDGRDVYRLKSDKPAIQVSLLKLNENLFHLVTPDDAMMIGSGGWSYTLNRNPAVTNSSLPTATLSAGDSPKTAQVIFDGRTPCREIADIAGLSMGADCFKIKWRITLNRDAATFQPTTFTIDSTFARDKSIPGKWTETRVRDAIIYRLVPDARAKPISLLVVDDLLLFLDGSDRPLTGNEDFSYTLERRPAARVSRLSR